MRGGVQLWRRWLVASYLVGVAALAFWVVGMAAGIRGWILTEDDVGIVAHSQGFGNLAFVWWVPAAILTLTMAAAAIASPFLRRLDAPGWAVGDS